MTDILKEPISRREFLRRTAAVVGTSLILPEWIVAAIATADSIRQRAGSSIKVEPVPSIPDLGLDINETGFWEIARKGAKWEVLPDATDKSKLSCPSWSANICQGKVSTNFNVAINRPLFEYMLDQSKLRNPSVRTNIIFVDDWGAVGLGTHQGGFTAITPEGTEQNTIVWLKPAAWAAFKAAKQTGLPLETHFQGFLSFYTSARLVHEMGHAGAETKALWKPGLDIATVSSDAIHPQIHIFHQQYERLYNSAGPDLAPLSLVVALEPTVDLNRLKLQIEQEARQKGLK